MHAITNILGEPLVFLSIEYAATRADKDIVSWIHTTSTRNIPSRTSTRQRCTPTALLSTMRLVARANQAAEEVAILLGTGVS